MRGVDFRGYPLVNIQTFETPGETPSHPNFQEGTQVQRKFGPWGFQKDASPGSQGDYR